jgi:hypothetical protein
MIIKLSIALSKVDKTKIVEKNGKKYLNLILMDSRKQSDYGDDGYIQHDQTKEEREAGEKPDYVGNWKWIYRDQPDKKAVPSRKAPRGDLGTDDLPTGGFRAGKASAGEEGEEDVPF